MKVEILSPKGLELETEADVVTVPTLSGEISVLPDVASGETKSGRTRPNPRLKTGLGRPVHHPGNPSNSGLKPFSQYFNGATTRVSPPPDRA